MDIAKLQVVTSITETHIARDTFAHLDGYKRIPRAVKKRNKKSLPEPASIKKGHRIMSEYFGI